jgi:hypothetical protein
MFMSGLISYFVCRNFELGGVAVYLRHLVMAFATTFATAFVSELYLVI